MNLLNKACKKLGVEVEETWIGDTGRHYKIDKEGQVRVWSDKYDDWIDAYYTLEHIIDGELTLKWQPELGEIYYIPQLNNVEKWRFDWFHWEDVDFDRWYFENGLVFKTEEEAIAVTNKMLDAVKEED